MGLAWHDTSKITPDVIAGYRKTVQVKDWDKGLWELTKASSELNLGSRVAQVQQPTLVITGDDDRIVPTAESVRLAGELPNAQLVVIPGCGHTPQEECPGPWLQAVTRFIEGL
jgi:pimeloyl-ACP methyl ester carboxylesterase